MVVVVVVLLCAISRWKQGATVDAPSTRLEGRDNRGKKHAEIIK